MLSRVEVRTRQGTQLNLPLDEVTGGYQITNIEGLGPVKATLSSSRTANQDGERYNSSRREKRNIKLSLDFEPDFLENSARSLRDRLYAFLMPKSEVTLRFIDSVGSYVDIQARVEDFDAPLFVREPGADISLLCFNPDFIDPNPIEVSGVSTPVTTEFTTIDYFGTIETGFLFTLNVDRAISGFSVIHRPLDGNIYQVDYEEDLIGGDVVAISSITGAKGATLTRSSDISSVLYAVSTSSNWLKLQNGANEFRVAIDGDPVPFTIRYTTRYGGL